MVTVALPYSFAQSDKALLRELAEENRKSIEALVLYPEDARLAILESSKHPEVLIKMKSLQTKTSAAFRTLIEDYPQNSQKIFYDISRYPGLTESLTAQHEDRNASSKLLEVLPEDQRADAADLVNRHWTTFSRINDLNQTTQRAFENLVASYPDPAQRAFRKLLDLPEVVDILNDDMRFTVLVGDVYREDPTWAIRKMDSLNLAVAKEHADELDNWKQTLENDPQTRDEMSAASQEYATEYGYNWSEGQYADPYENSPFYHYPYWFGYPWWEPFPCWSPYPYWWNWGCGFYPNYIRVVYMPSSHFMHWYFDHPHHHYQYNHLSSGFINHYNGHRHSGTSIATEVGTWHDRNKGIISEEFLKDKSRLPDHLKAYGKFEEARVDYNRKNPGRATSPETFLDNNKRKYSDLSQSRDQARVETERRQTQEPNRRSDWAPGKEPVQQGNESVRPARIEKPSTTPQNPPRQDPIPNRPDARPRKEFQMDEAKDYHRDGWNAAKNVSPPRQQPQMAPRTSPSPQPRSAPPSQPRTNPAPRSSGRKN